MSEFTCKYCGCTSYVLKKKGVQVGRYCRNQVCHKWSKWVGKKELPTLMQQGHYIYEEHEAVKLLNETAEYSGVSEDDLPSTLLQSLSNQEVAATTTGGQFIDAEDITTVRYKEDVIRVEGCDHCKAVPYEEQNDISVSINKQHHLLFVIRASTGGVLAGIEINYCPSCGSKL